MERCPSCRARIREHLKCQRCGTDLGVLLQIAKEAQQAFDVSVINYGQDALTPALELAEQAVKLRRLPMYLQWYAFLQSREFSASGTEA